MNLKILTALLIYYSIISAFFLFSASANAFDDYNTTIQLNNSELQEEEIDKGGLFNSGVSFARFFVFVGFGVGLPNTTPSWFSLLFFLWQTAVLILTIGFIIDSIWSG